MKKILVSIVALGLAAFAVSGAQMMKTETRYAQVMGTGGKGSFVFITLPDGTHGAFLQLSGLKPSAKVYATHVHFNDKGDANCKAQNGDKIIPLTNLKTDDKGNAVSYTGLPASAKYPAGTTYVNIHSNDPQDVGPSIACGDIMK